MKNILRKIRERGYKATSARLAILEIFSKSKKPLDAKDVYKKVGKNVNEVTVYRTITSFEKTGIIEKVDLRKDSVYFELAKSHHHHIVCTNCDKIEDFKHPTIEKLLGRIVEKSSEFKNITEHSLELFGLCVKCLPAELESA